MISSLMDQLVPCLFLGLWWETSMQKFHAHQKILLVSCHSPPPPPLTSILAPGTAVPLIIGVVSTVSLITIMLVIVVIVVYKIKRLVEFARTLIIQVILSSTYTEANCWSFLSPNFHIPPQLIITVRYYHLQITFKRSLMVERRRLAHHWKSYHFMTCLI